MIARWHDMPFGTKMSETGVTFRLWAPTARTVNLCRQRRCLSLARFHA
jgi:1,4-alpha-glucan branching enzyme